jgi:hypothetical protein
MLAVQTHNIIQVHWFHFQDIAPGIDEFFNEKVGNRIQVQLEPIVQGQFTDQYRITAQNLQNGILIKKGQFVW